VRFSHLRQLSGDEATGDLAVSGLDQPATSLTLIDFKLPPPRDLAEDERQSLMRSCVTRTWDEAEELRAGGYLPADSQGRKTSAEMWMLLIVRMVTRVAEPTRGTSEDEESKKDEKEGSSDLDFYMRQDQLRQTVCNYIMSDFPSRYVFDIGNGSVLKFGERSGCDWRQLG
jgi:symplekin